MSAYTYRQFSIRPEMLASLRRYIDQRIIPGQFLQAVLSNDLCDACGRADDENMANLPAFAAYLYNEAPSACWGSPEKVAAWVTRNERTAA